MSEAYSTCGQGKRSKNNPFYKLVNKESLAIFSQSQKFEEKSKLVFIMYKHMTQL